MPVVKAFLLQGFCTGVKYVAQSLMITAQFAMRVESFSPSPQVVCRRETVDGSTREEAEDTFWKVKDDRSPSEIAFLLSNKLKEVTLEHQWLYLLPS